jgi:hypothetical protein
MIKIENIKPLGEQKIKSIESIQDDYLVKVKKDTNPYDILERSNQTGKIDEKTVTKKFKLDTDQKLIIKYLKENFDSIITDKPNQLLNHIKSINEKILGFYYFDSFSKKNKYKLNDFGCAILEIFGYNKYFRTKTKKGIWLAEQLNIKACPYCNSQYTLIVRSDYNERKAKFQFDHFFSQKRYPFLSISLYNLIPSCALCNLSKSNTEFTFVDNYHPYVNSLADISEFKLIFKPDVKKISSGDVCGLNLDIEFKSLYSNYETFVNNHNKTFDIESIYNRHRDIAEDLLYKAIVNNSDFKSDMMNIKGLFNNDERLFQRYLIGNYAFEDEIMERPLAKYTQDIARQLELIK